MSIKALKTKLVNEQKRHELSKMMPIEIQDRLNEDEYSSILEYFIQYDMNDTHFPARFPKEKTNLARTVNLVKDPISNEIHIFLEIKSKYIFGRKSKINDVIGSRKKGSHSFSIDSNSLFMNLNYYHNNTITNRYAIENEFNCAYRVYCYAQSMGFDSSDIPIIVPALGKTFFKAKNYRRKQFLYKTSFYSPLASCDLTDWISSHPFMIDNMNQYHHISYQIHIAVALCHEAGIIHQDIKPDNILVVEPLNKIFLNDFGVAVEFAGEIHYDACATRYYASPELLIAYPNNKSYWQYSVYASTVLRIHEVLKDRLAQEAYNIDYKTASVKNDVWAEAVTIFTCYTGFFPEVGDVTFNHYPWLCAMFESVREKRPTSLEALITFEKNSGYTPAFSASLLLTKKEKVSLRGQLNQLTIEDDTSHARQNDEGSNKPQMKHNI